MQRLIKLSFVLWLFTLPVNAFAYLGQSIFFEGVTPVEQMVEWIVDNSRYQYHGDAYPRVEIHSRLEICTATYPDSEPHENCNIAGYYDHDANLIVIVDQPTEHMVKDHFTEVVLLHELVHFVQYYDGEYERAECKAALERDAFKLQDLWIDQQRIDPEQKNDALFVVFATMCPGKDLMHGNTH